MFYNTVLGIIIGFLNTTYTVSEGVGDAPLKIGVISGDLETDTVVNISTTDDSAVCEFIVYLTMCNYHGQ